MAPSSVSNLKNSLAPLVLSYITVVNTISNVSLDRSREILVRQDQRANRYEESNCQTMMNSAKQQCSRNGNTAQRLQHLIAENERSIICSKGTQGAEGTAGDKGDGVS